MRTPSHPSPPPAVRWRTVGELFQSNIEPNLRTHASRDARWRRPMYSVVLDHAAPYDREHRIEPPDNRRCPGDFPETSSAQTPWTRTGPDTTRTETSSRCDIGEHNAGMFLDGQGPSPAKKPFCLYSCRRSSEPATYFASFKCVTSSFIYYLLVVRILRNSTSVSAGQA